MCNPGARGQSCGRAGDGLEDRRHAVVEEALLGRDVHQPPTSTARDMAALGVRVRGSKAEGRVVIDYIDGPKEAVGEGVVTGVFVVKGARSFGDDGVRVRHARRSWRGRVKIDL